MIFLKIALDEKYLMIINFIVVFYIYDKFVKSFIMTYNKLYDFLLDVVLISIFSYVSTIVTLTLIIGLIYIIFINSKNLNSFSFFNKLEAVAIAVAYINELETIGQLQIKFKQVLFEDFT